MEEEIVAKWLELLHTGLPVCALSASEIAITVPWGQFSPLSVLACTAQPTLDFKIVFCTLEIALGWDRTLKP